MISVSEVTTGPDQILHKKRIVTGQNNIPINGERYLIQYILGVITSINSLKD